MYFIVKHTSHVTDLTDELFLIRSDILRNIGPLKKLCINDAYKLHYTSHTVNASWEILRMKEQIKDYIFLCFIVIH